MENLYSSRKILLVDDDPDDRNYFCEALTEIDSTIECVIAKDGEQALKILSDENARVPDYIFLGLRIPKVSGKQCLLYIKSTDRLKNIPVIIYSTSREIEESEEMQQLGAVRFISKPTDTKEIYYVISQVLDEQQGSISTTN